MIRATMTDQPAVAAFLCKHIATSMFPLSNLRNHGIAGGHPRAVTFWVRWQGGAITDVVTLSDEGMLFPQCPTGPWGDVSAVLRGTNVKGILGDAKQVAGLRSALRLPKSKEVDVTEPLYQMSLDDLQMPDMAGFGLRPLVDAPLDLMHEWRTAYVQETLAVLGEDAPAQAERDLAGYLEQDSHRALYDGAEPVAMTGFNAILSDVVQIGGVYTPPALRGRGHARRAVALHLTEARKNGVKDAVLFAANPAAEKAYQAIGFRQTGHFSIIVYDDHQVAHG